jgi:periplasmic protein TonB
VRKDARRSIRTWIIGGSVAFHAALAVAAALLPNEDRHETAAIELSDISKLRKKDPPKPPPPPPPPPPPEEKPKPPPPPPKAQAQAKVANDAPKMEAPPVAMGEDGFADLGGVALGNGSGGGGDGVALGGPGAGSGAAGPTSVAATTKATATKKIVQQLAPAPADVCSNPPVRPKRKVPVAPKYTMQARQAEIEGVVRVEVTIDENGKVISARVVTGLGYGLDEAALAAAKASVFEPASRCGKAIVGTVILPFRFEST